MTRRRHVKISPATAARLEAYCAVAGIPVDEMAESLIVDVLAEKRAADRIARRAAETAEDLL